MAQQWQHALRAVPLSVGWGAVVPQEPARRMSKDDAPKEVGRAHTT